MIIEEVEVDIHVPTYLMTCMQTLMWVKNTHIFEHVSVT